MTHPTAKLLHAFDGHDTEAVRAALEAGADAVSPIKGKPPVKWLLEEYTRSDRLQVCLRLLLERGAKVEDPVLTSVLLDDAEGLRTAFASDPSILRRRVTLISAFVSLADVTFLHVAAEYGNQNAARALIDLGADVNARAALTKSGLNGHTALFHTVNSHANRSASIMHMLLEAGADSTLRLNGLEWGKGYQWETVFFDVTPISFAQMGLMPQVHRIETDIYANIRALLAACGRDVPELGNIPNRYLAGSH